MAGATIGILGLAHLTGAGVDEATAHIIEPLVLLPRLLAPTLLQAIGLFTGGEGQPYTPMIAA